MPKTPIFYFGTVIFFVGLILLAAGISNVIGEFFGSFTIAELVSGIVLMVIGFRATSNSPVREKSSSP